MTGSCAGRLLPARFCRTVHNKHTRATLPTCYLSDAMPAPSKAYLPQYLAAWPPWSSQGRCQLMSAGVVERWPQALALQAQSRRRAAIPKARRRCMQGTSHS